MALLDDETDDTVINFVVKKLEIMLTAPENVIVEQGATCENEEDLEMYFLAKGECVVLVKDKHNI